MEFRGLYKIFDVCFFVIIGLQFKASQQCSDKLCFTWSVTPDNLTLKCTVHLLLHKVSIIDPSGALHADCLPSFPSVHCEQYVKNGIVTQNIVTNETIYVVNGTIDTRLNGQWECRHAVFKDVAFVEVTILKIKDKIEETEAVQSTLGPVGHNCWRISLFWSFSFFVGVMFVTIALACCKSYQLCQCYPRYIFLIDNLFNKCIKCGIGNHNNIFCIKTVLFWVFTLLYFGVIIAATINRICVPYILFLVLGLLYGGALSFLCLFNRKAMQRKSDKNCSPLNQPPSLTELNADSGAESSNQPVDERNAQHKEKDAAQSENKNKAKSDYMSAAQFDNKTTVQYEGVTSPLSDNKNASSFESGRPLLLTHTDKEVDTDM